MLVGCHGEPSAEIPPTETAQSFWPAAERPLALLTDGAEFALTDGILVQPLGISTRHDPYDPYSGASVPVIETAGSIAILEDEALFVISLNDGEVQRRSCEDCRGLAATPGGLATILPTGTIVEFNTRLEQVGSYLVGDRVGQQKPPEDYFVDPSWEPAFLLLDSGGRGTTIIASMPEWAVLRGGPGLVSEFSPSGDLKRESEVELRVAAARPDVTGEHLVVAGVGSSGACYTHVSLSVLDSSGSTHLLSDATKGSRARMVIDWSWNGDYLIWIDQNTGNLPGLGGDCSIGEWSINVQSAKESGGGGPPTRIESPGLTQLRILDGCDNALAVRETGTGNSLQAMHGGVHQDLGDYAIVWNTPPARGCEQIADLVEILK